MLMHSASTLKWGGVLTPMLLGGVLQDILRSFGSIYAAVLGAWVFRSTVSYGLSVYAHPVAFC
jgi:hypothetical protein